MLSSSTLLASLLSATVTLAHMQMNDPLALGHKDLPGIKTPGESIHRQGKACTDIRLHPHCTAQRPIRRYWTLSLQGSVFLFLVSADPFRDITKTVVHPSLHKRQSQLARHSLLPLGEARFTGEDLAKLSFLPTMVRPGTSFNRILVDVLSMV
jgi:hypothetical protein